MIQRYFALLLALLTISVAPVLAEVKKTELEPTAMMTAETRLLISLLEQAHFEGVPISDLKLDELYPNFMSDLDYNRLFLTQDDHDLVLRRYGRNVERDLRRGDLRPAFEVYEIYREAALDRIEWVLGRLEGEFSFESEMTFRADRHELSWPRNVVEADRLWEKRLTYELLSDLLNDKELEEAKSNVTRRYERLRRALLETEAHEVEEIFLSALSRLYDPHSSFLSASTLEDFSIQMQLSLVGIGAQLLSEDGYCTIKELIPGGPAALDGSLKPNDRIVAVAQEVGEPVDVIDMKLRHVVEMIRGEKGTTVHLTVIPAEASDSSVRRTISLVRDEIRLTASRAKATIHEVPGEDGEIVPVGVIEIPSFYGSVGSERPGQTKTSTTDDVRELIGVLKEQGIEALILDLRRNGGGLLTEAIRLTGLFIELGPVVQVKSSNGDLRVDPDRDPSVSYSGPLGILVSRQSASASEIVAGALKSYNRALVLGESSTHGKGTVQAIYELKNYLFRSGGKTGAAKLTVQKFYLPDGQSTQNRGVVPHIVFPSFNEFLPIGEADLPNALAWDTIPAEGWEEARDRFPIRSRLNEEMVEKLRSQSEERQKKSEEFRFLQENIDWFRERQERKTVSLNLAERRNQKEADQEFRDRMNAVEKELASAEFEYREFGLDSAEEEPVLVSHEGEEDLDEKSVKLDIHLRESLRVLADLVDLGDQVWALTAQKEKDRK